MAYQTGPTLATAKRCRRPGATRHSPSLSLR